MANPPQPESHNDASPPDIERRWIALHAAGQEIGDLASLAPEPMIGSLAEFPHQIEARGGARLSLAREQLEDLDAILQPGLAALRMIAARGQDTTAPALALWREFHALRQVLLSLAKEPQPDHSSVTA